MEILKNMKYTNKDFYDYILKIDNVDSSLHEIYVKFLKLLVKEGLDNLASDIAIECFYKLFEIRQHKLHEDEIYELKWLLYYDVAFRRIIKNKDGSYSVYPELKELPSIEDLLLYYSLGLKMSVKEIIDFLKPKIDAQKIKYKQVDIGVYYGNAKYLIIRTQAIYDAIGMLNNREDIAEKDLINNALLNVNSLLRVMLNVVGLENEKDIFEQLRNFQITINKNQYDKLKMAYLKVLKQEKMLMNVSEKLWQEYAAKNNGVLIHQLTEEAVKYDQMEKICTSFYSKNVKIITSYFDGNIGYVYPMDIANAFEVCEKDVGSWKVTKDFFVENGLPDSWQLDDTNLFYENPYNTKLFLPEYIEKQILKKQNFAEIIIDNRKRNIKPLYCFYTNGATSWQIKKITDLAMMQNLEVKYLDVQNKISKR